VHSDFSAAVSSDPKGPNIDDIVTGGRDTRQPRSRFCLSERLVGVNFLLGLVSRIGVGSVGARAYLGRRALVVAM
jgi:hypothetical protein